MMKGTRCSMFTLANMPDKEKKEYSLVRKAVFIRYMADAACKKIAKEDIMKRKRITAIVLSAVLSLSVFLPVTGISALAAETAVMEDLVIEDPASENESRDETNGIADFSGQEEAVSEQGNAAGDTDSSEQGIVAGDTDSSEQGNAGGDTDSSEQGNAAGDTDTFEPGDVSTENNVSGQENPASGRDEFSEEAGASNQADILEEADTPVYEEPISDLQETGETETVNEESTRDGEAGDDDHSSNLKAWISGHEDLKNESYQHLSIDEVPGPNIGDTYRIQVMTETEDGSEPVFQWYQNRRLLTGETASYLDAVIYQESWNRFTCIVQDQYGNSVEIVASIYGHGDQNYDDNLTAWIVGHEYEKAASAGDFEISISDWGDLSLNEEDTVSLEVRAETKDGSEPFFQWYDSDLNLIEGADTSSFEAVLSEDRCYECRIQDIYGNEVVIKCRFEKPTNLKAWVIDHENQSGNSYQHLTDWEGPGNLQIGDSYQIQIMAETKDGSDPTFQWYQNNKLIEGATSPVFDAVIYQSKGNYFYCKVRDDYGNLVQISCRFYVRGSIDQNHDDNLKAWIVGHEEMKDKSQQTIYDWGEEPIYIGDTVTLQAEAETKDGSIPVVQWYKGFLEDEKPIEGANSLTYEAMLDQDWNVYTCCIQDDYGNQVAIECCISAQILEGNLIAWRKGFKTDAASYFSYKRPAFVGDTVLLEVCYETMDGSVPSFQWYDPDSNPIEGATAASCEVLLNEEGDFYYECRIQDRYGNIATVPFQISTTTVLVLIEGDEDNYSSYHDFIAPYGVEYELTFLVRAYDLDGITWSWQLDDVYNYEIGDIPFPEIDEQPERIVKDGIEYAAFHLKDTIKSMVYCEIGRINTLAVKDSFGNEAEATVTAHIGYIDEPYFEEIQDNLTISKMEYSDNVTVEVDEDGRTAYYVPCGEEFQFNILLETENLQEYSCKWEYGGFEWFEESIYGGSAYSSLDYPKPDLSETPQFVTRDGREYAMFQIRDTIPENAATGLRQYGCAITDGKGHWVKESVTLYPTPDIIQYFDDKDQLERYLCQRICDRDKTNEESDHNVVITVEVSSEIGAELESHIYGFPDDPEPDEAEMNWTPFGTAISEYDELQYLFDNGWSVIGWDIGTHTKRDGHRLVYYRIVLFNTPEELKQAMDEIDRIVQDLGLEDDEKTDLEKVRAIWDYMKDVEYLTDVGLYYATLYGAAVEHQANCMGQSALFYVLCDRAGIEAWFNSAHMHRWNIVKVDGLFYNIDCVAAAHDYCAQEFLLGTQDDIDVHASGNTQWDHTPGWKEQYPIPEYGYYRTKVKETYGSKYAGGPLGCMGLYWKYADGTLEIMGNGKWCSHINNSCWIEESICDPIPDEQKVRSVVMDSGVLCTGFDLFPFSNLESITIKGHAPSLSEVQSASYDFSNVIVYYPKNDSSWGKAIRDALSTQATWVPVDENGKVNVANTKITGISNSTYRASAIKPIPRVSLGPKTLKAGTDYTVAYKNNINAGTATVTITGKGKYTGTVSKTFKINQAAQPITVKSSAASVAVGKTATVSVSGVKESASCTYKSSDTGIATIVASTGRITAKKVGTVTITVTTAATKNYKATSKSLKVKVVPAATSSLTAENQVKGIKLIWKKVTGATGYDLYRNGTRIKAISGGSTVTFTDTAANTNGTKYAYKIIAKAATGSSTLSKSCVIYCVARPAVSSAANTAAGKMTVKWGKNAKATGYQIQYSTDKTFKSGSKTVTIESASTVSRVISGMTRGKTYYVRIRTYKTVGSAKYWSIWSVARSVKITK